MEQMRRSPNIRRGTGKCFKMLFTRQEYEGHSLSGGKSNIGEQRLARKKKEIGTSWRVLLFYYLACIFTDARKWIFLQPVLTMSATLMSTLGSTHPQTKYFYATAFVPILFCPVNLQHITFRMYIQSEWKTVLILVRGQIVEYLARVQEMCAHNDSEVFFC